MKKAVFIDKDGTLIKDVPYNVNPELVELYEDSARSLKALKDNGYMLIVVSNQSGIARGYFSPEALKNVEEKIQSNLAAAGVQIDALYFCPHHPEGIVEDYRIDCDCRKPKPGMLLKASRNFDIDLNQSWMIGDILHDVEAGNKAGCKTILINNGNETEWRINGKRLPNGIASTISDAVDLILSEERKDEHTSTLC
jgi:D-glycero-D-manno-heptose 1,7-bisphosphate phosphatase